MVPHSERQKGRKDVKCKTRTRRELVGSPRAALYCRSRPTCLSIASRFALLRSFSKAAMASSSLSEAALRKDSYNSLLAGLSWSGIAPIHSKRIPLVQSFIR